MKNFEGRKAYLVFMLILGVFIILPGCGRGVFGGGHWDKALVSLTVTPTAASMPVTGTLQYAAIAAYSDGSSSDVTASTSWTSSNVIAGGVDVATVGSSSGVATAKAIGQSTIAAAYGGRTATATLTVNSATSVSFVSIAVTPALASIPVSGTQQYTAIETFSDGSTFDRTASSDWIAANVVPGGADVATVGPHTGVATGKAIGQSNLTATYGAKIATAVLTVNAATSKSFSVTPALASIPVTGTQRYTATETFSDGTTIDRTQTSAWTSTDAIAGTGVATFSLDGVGGGIVTGSKPGNSTITATFVFNGVTKAATAALTVNDAASKSFKVTPLTATIAINGGTQQFAAIETFSDGSTSDRTLSSSWTAADVLPAVGVAIVGSNTGIATGKAKGDSTITATYVVGGVTQTAHATLHVTAPDPGTAGSAPVLGTAATYGIIATNSITSSSVKTHIYGDVALTVGVASSVTGAGFNDGGAAPNLTSAGVTNSTGVTPGIINTSDNGNLSIAQMAKLQSDLNAAYLDLSSRPASLIYPAGAVELSGKVLAPGVYRANASGPTDTYALSSINGPLVLDAAGNPDAIFVLQAGKVTTTTGSVVLQGGAQPKNVFWVVTSDATIGDGASTFFQGTVVAGNTITVSVNSNVEGRMLAGALGAGSITVSGVITVPR